MKTFKKLLIGLTAFCATFCCACNMDWQWPTWWTDSSNSESITEESVDGSLDVSNEEGTSIDNGSESVPEEGSEEESSKEENSEEENSEGESSEEVHTHSLTLVEAQEGDCLNDGNIAYYTCDCGKYFADEDGLEELTAEQLLVKGSHKVTNWTEEKEATCTTDGNIGYYTCDVCGKYVLHEDSETVWTEEDVVIKAAHGLGYHEATKPSGKENGTIAYYSCVACGKYFLDDNGLEELTEEDLVVLSAYNIPDFVVEVEEGRDPVVLHLSDTQIWWWGATAEEQCYRYVREVVGKTNPDLIILTGDVVYGRFDPDGKLLTGLITFMETLKTPWAPVFGNHDNESLMGVDWQCQQFEAAEYCLFKQGDVTGNGNYSVGLAQGDELLRVFYMMDSNGCGKPMCDSEGVQTMPAPGTNVVKTTQGFGQDQIDWYTEEINAIHAVDADVKISMAYHIQQAVFAKAFEQYEEYDGLTTNSALNNPLNLDTMETARETDFGYVGRPMKGGWDYDYKIFNDMKALGVDSIFVGHEHCNSSSIVYQGVRLQYGQKSSTYDRYNSVTEDGQIVGDSSTPAGAHPIMGGTVIPVSSADGSIGKGYLCYYGDPFYFEPKPEPIPVEGLQYGTDLTAQSDKSTLNGSVQAVTYEGTNAYYIVSGSSYNRMYINVDLLRGKDLVTFDILVPEEATNSAGAATNEFAIRVKPNPTEETMPGVSSGYLWFDASYTNERKIVIGEWQTITIDISGFADVCTEFGIYFVEGNNGAYIKNVAVSEKIDVNGLTLDAGMLQEGKTMSVEALAFDNTVNAYKVTSGSDSAKIFFDTALAVQNNRFTFSVYIPTDSPVATSTEFYLRVKPNDTLTAEHGSSDGKYVCYSSTTSSVIRKVTRGEWTTVTVDITAVGADCTEFSFMFSTGTVIWFKDIAFTTDTVETEPEEVVVNGVALINPAASVTLTAEAFDDTTNAYKVTAQSQGKVYIDTALIANKSTFTFSVYVSETVEANTTVFMLRIKPNELDEDGNGYIYYTPNVVTVGEWQTFTVDISSFGTSCTEFSFVIPVGQTVWFRDITIS